METKHIVLVVIGVVIILFIVYKKNCKTCNGYVKTEEELISEEEARRLSEQEEIVELTDAEKQAIIDAKND